MTHRQAYQAVNTLHNAAQHISWSDPDAVKILIDRERDVMDLPGFDVRQFITWQSRQTDK